MAERTDEAAAAGPPRWLLALMVAGAVVALLLLGASAGLLLGVRGSPDNAAPPPDSVDVGFCQDMTVHHRQAATMAALARERASEPRLRTLAFDIETTQIEQVGRMQGWLSLWGRDRLPSGEHMRWMTGEPGHDHPASTAPAAAPADRMPGMATPEELLRLRDLSGVEADREFLRLMIRHHEGGVPMAQAILERTNRDVVEQLARAIVESQQAEIETMTALLESKGGPLAEASFGAAA